MLYNEAYWFILPTPPLYPNIQKVLGIYQLELLNMYRYYSNYTYLLYFRRFLGCSTENIRCCLL